MDFGTAATALLFAYTVLALLIGVAVAALVWWVWRNRRAGNPQDIDSLLQYKPLLPVAAALVTSEVVGGFLLWRAGAPFGLVVLVLLSVSVFARWQGKQLEARKGRPQ